ncbi:MAG: PEP-CTERM sorting domain-containing protein [Fimbriimonadaceae bacterium]
MRTKSTMVVALAMVVAVASAQQVVGPGPGLNLQQFRGDYGSPSFGYTVSNTDLIAGMIATNTIATGWHPATPSGLQYREGALTDGDNWLSIPNGNLAGLINDFPLVVGTPAQRFRYTFSETMNIMSIAVLTGNDGRDGRIFHTYAVYGIVGGGERSLIAYVESAQLGSLNNADNNNNREIATILTRTNGILGAVDALEFDFYSVDNTGGQYRDAWNGVNPFTGIDDGLTAAFVSPIVREIDVFGEPVPEPATLAALGLGALALMRRRTRR